MRRLVSNASRLLTVHHDISRYTACQSTGSGYAAVMVAPDPGVTQREAPDAIDLALDPAAIPDTPPEAEATWRAILTGTHPNFRRRYRLFRRLPSSPRCKMCAAPFEGPFAFAMRSTGRSRWAKNSRYCAKCFTILEEHHGGAEIECSLLFADIRGSTSLAEGMRPTEFSRLLERFYAVASEILVDHDAIVDKFVGDEVVAIFIPALAEERHAARAIQAARRLLEATGHRDPGGPWVPLGAGVTTGTAYVGAVGGSGAGQLTALGDIVNVAARLASAASPGRILATTAAVAAAQVEAPAPTPMSIRGRQEPVDVVAIEVGPVTLAG